MKHSEKFGKREVFLGLIFSLFLIAVAGIAWGSLREAREYRESIHTTLREIDLLQAERHRIAGLPPPTDKYTSAWTQVELENLEARQNSIGNAIAQRIQQKSLNTETLSALQYTEKKINNLRMEFELRRKERLERFASSSVQKGCRWIRCPEPFTFPGEAILIKMRAEKPDFGRVLTKSSGRK